MKTIRSIIYMNIILLSITSCMGSENMNNQLMPLKSISSADVSSLNRLSGAKIYFGHQSVGFNIMDGLNELLKNNPRIKLRISQSKIIDDFKSPVFGHSANGQNMNPVSKIESFTGLMESGLGNRLNMAFFKFCYVDIDRNTDIEKLFDRYKSSMAALKKKYPVTGFIHVTVPLTIDNGLRDFIKRILNKDDNIKRNHFNEMLKKEYKADEIFDLARYESTHPDGKREFSRKDGKNIYSLVPEYTDDGGHLNKKASLMAAEQLVLFLAARVGNQP
jgi:hypothetical protein